MGFELGKLAATPRAAQVLTRAEILTALALHSNGEWGELDPEDVQANEDALHQNGRLVSAYTFRDVRGWVITEADRAATTVLRPDDY